MALGLSVAEAQARIDAREFGEWMAFAGLEPFGEERADLRAAIVASTVANTARDPKTQRDPFTPQEFMPKFEKETTEQTPEQMLAIVEMLNAAFGGKDLRPT